MSANGTNPNATQHVESDGTQVENGDSASGEESEGEGDDDMIDRISSSPSIDEGKHPTVLAVLPNRRPDGANFNNSLRRSPALPPRKDSLEHYVQRLKSERQISSPSALSLPARSRDTLALPTTPLDAVTSVPYEHLSGEGRYPGNDKKSVIHSTFDIFED